MSMNKYMHPRNPYKSPPDFKMLALEYPEFREFIKMDITGKFSLDFKDVKSLRALSCTLLKKDFGLDVEIPLNKLIPTIPLRLNYILWLEDLLGFIGKTEEVKGIDIGTGASCIYPLLAAKKNKWHMLATEVDAASITCARNNVQRNFLDSFITVEEIKDDKLIESVVNDKEFDFCMCNPPFFSSTQELHPFFKTRKSNRPHPKNAFCASVNEVVSKGGEVEFIEKLVSESQRLGPKIKIYTTMVGHKCSLPSIKQALRAAKVTSFKESEFCQGNTTRWGIAWTFCDLDLRKLIDTTKQGVKSNKPKPHLQMVWPISEINHGTLNSVIEKLLSLFKDLHMTSEEVTRNKNVHRYFISAYSNTWSNQRRKRREKLRKNSESCEIPMSFENPGSPTNNNVIETGAKSPGKRTTDDSFDGSFIKKLKISSDDNSDSAAVFFKFMVAVRSDKNNIILELNTIDDDTNREYIHQILQYIKNNFEIDH